jgi:hypothetical protein
MRHLLHLGRPVCVLATGRSSRVMQGCESTQAGERSVGISSWPSREITPGIAIWATLCGNGDLDSLGGGPEIDDPDSVGGELTQLKENRCCPMGVDGFGGESMDANEVPNDVGRRAFLWSQ